MINLKIVTPFGVEAKIEAPDDLEEIPIGEIESLLRDYARRKRTSKHHDSIMESDDALAEWMKKKRLTAVVRASTYSNVSCCYTKHIRTHSFDINKRASAPPKRPEICSHQEILPDWWRTRDKRRPVHMAGSIIALIANHSYTQPHISTGWCDDVIARYLRKIKYTSLNPEKNETFIRSLRSEMFARYPTHSNGRRNEESFNVGYDHIFKEYNAFIKGRSVTLTHHQWKYISNLYKKLKKFEYLEDKIIDSDAGPTSA